MQFTTSAPSVVMRSTLDCTAPASPSAPTLVMVQPQLSKLTSNLLQVPVQWSREEWMSRELEEDARWN